MSARAPDSEVLLHGSTTNQKPCMTSSKEAREDLEAGINTFLITSPDHLEGIQEEAQEHAEHQNNNAVPDTFVLTDAADFASIF